MIKVVLCWCVLAYLGGGAGFASGSEGPCLSPPGSTILDYTGLMSSVDVDDHALIIDLTSGVAPIGGETNLGPFTSPLYASVGVLPPARAPPYRSFSLFK